MTTLEAVVRELRRSEARSRGAQYLQHAVFAGAAWTLAVLLAARLVPVEQSWRLAAFGVPVLFVAVGVAWVLLRPRPMNLMRTADIRLELKERLSTAWERRANGGPMDELLRRDALAHASLARLANAFPVRLSRGEALLVGVLAVAVIALVALPNPMDQLLAQRHADQAAQAHAVAAIATAKKAIAAATPAPVDPRVQQILKDAQTKIAGASDPREALQAVTPAEQQLLQLSDPQTPSRVSSAANLAGSLASTTAGRSAAQAINAGPSSGAQALRDLAAQLGSLSAQDRAELAKALASAAQRATDPSMSALLQQAAGALNGGDLGAAASALNALSGQLDSLQQQVNDDQQIAAAINGLEAARQQLASQADRDAGQGAPSSSTAPGASPTGSAQANGGGNGNGSGSGSGTGSGSGNGTGSGSGSGGTGGAGSSGSGGGAGPAAKSTERVYVPGQPIPGQSENDPAPLGPGQDVPLTPYSQVIEAYQQAALDVANQTLIPGSEKDLIRQYFSSLGGGTP